VSERGETESTRYCGHYWPVVAAPDGGACGAVGGMRIGRGNRSIRRKPTPAPLYPPQIPHDHGGKPAANSLSYVTV
jgi:hypothetical protein